MIIFLLCDSFNKILFLINHLFLFYKHHYEKYLRKIFELNIIN